MIMRLDPIASGASTNGSSVFPPLITRPTVRTRKNVPMNSVTYFCADMNFLSMGYCPGAKLSARRLPAKKEGLAQHRSMEMASGSARQSFHRLGAVERMLGLAPGHEQRQRCLHHRAQKHPDEDPGQSP